MDRFSSDATIRPVSVFKESPGAQVRTPIAIGVILALVIVLSAVYYYGRSPAPVGPREAEVTAPPAPPPPAAEKPATPAAPATPPPTPAPTPAPSPARKTSRPAPVAEKPASPGAAPTRATLTIESDVAGASVFVDRQFVGTAPLTLENVAPGAKQISLSADGYDGVSRSVDVDAGVQTVALRFKEVRLDKRIAVTHKHGVGACAGELVATVDGLRYVTTNAKDAGTIPFPALEQFLVDYLDKNLRVKQRGGRTWNFTDANANADALFVFHRDVELARKKLAQGYAPVR